MKHVAVEAGDKVKVTKLYLESAREFFDVGHVGVVHNIDQDGDIWVDFSGQDNDYVVDDGIWCVGKLGEHLEVVDASN